jgi:hypothetical protein
MPKEAKPFLVLWLGGLLITDALIAAAFAAYFLLAHGEMVCQMEHVSSDSDARKPCTNGAVAESADCGIAIVPIVECDVADNRPTPHSGFEEAVQNEHRVFWSHKAG